MLTVFPFNISLVFIALTNVIELIKIEVIKIMSSIRKTYIWYALEILTFSFALMSDAFSYWIKLIILFWIAGLLASFYYKLHKLEAVNLLNKK
jgi:hypothetical protein